MIPLTSNASYLLIAIEVIVQLSYMLIGVETSLYSQLVCCVAECRLDCVGSK